MIASPRPWSGWSRLWGWRGRPDRGRGSRGAGWREAWRDPAAPWCRARWSPARRKRWSSTRRRVAARWTGRWPVAARRRVSRLGYPPATPSVTRRPPAVGARGSIRTGSLSLPPGRVRCPRPAPRLGRPPSRCAQLPARRCPARCRRSFRTRRSAARRAVPARAVLRCRRCPSRSGWPEPGHRRPPASPRRGG